MKTVLHKEKFRGSADHGWLKAKHSFSFANWYDPEKVQFGALRVLNDDEVAPSMGFGEHPHDNMEIITIPLEGSLRHKDSQGNEGVITTGEVQVMSAGTGIRHSEMNASAKIPVRLFQIWIFTKKKNVDPRYQQIQLPASKPNEFIQVVSPNEEDDGAWIHQDAWIHLIDMDRLSESEYELKNPDSGVYIMNVSGEISLANQILNKRDAIGITDVKKVPIIALEKSRVLIIEVPMNI